jgi:hypothetical protein
MCINSSGAKKFLFSRTSRSSLEAHTKMSTWFLFREQSVRGVKWITTLHPVQGLRMSTVIPLLPFLAWKGKKITLLIFNAPGCSANFWRSVYNSRLY